MKKSGRAFDAWEKCAIKNFAVEGRRATLRPFVAVDVADEEL
jgi:hypothetical protein